MSEVRTLDSVIGNNISKFWRITRLSCDPILYEVEIGDVKQTVRVRNQDCHAAIKKAREEFQNESISKRTLS